MRWAGHSRSLTPAGLRGVHRRLGASGLKFCLQEDARPVDRSECFPGGLFQAVAMILDAYSRKSCRDSKEISTSPLDDPRQNSSIQACAGPSRWE
jgi:hypothetical protein